MNDKALSIQEQQIRFIEQNQDKFDQVPCDVKHTFAPGIYIRELHMYPGYMVIGHKHTTDHLNIMIKGNLDVQQNDGSFINIHGQISFTSKPGRKIAFIHEHTVWLNLFPTSDQNISRIESLFFDKSEEWEAGKDSIKRIQYQSKYPGDIRILKGGMTKLPYGTYGFQVDKSAIHGQGLFASCSFAPGEVVGPIRNNNKLTICAGKVNHSDRPNAQIVDDAYLVAIAPISGCVGGLLGDEITIDYRNYPPCQESQ